MMSGMVAKAVRAAIAAGAMWAAVSAIQAQETAGARVAFDIHAATLEQALTQFGAATGLQVLTATKLVEGKIAPTVVGEMRAADALRKLLEGTSLQAEMINSKTVAIREAKPDAVTRTRTAWSDSAFRLSQSDSSGGGGATDADPTLSESVPKEKLAQVVVTGTHISDVGNTGSELIVLDQKYFERTGYANIEDVIRTVPQVAAGPSQFSAVDGMRAGTAYVNNGRGTGVNLRGFGAEATLVLVDGNRQANAGTGGNFVDISGIPLSAVERVEILTDGASAIYGSDAVGGVVNIILKKKYDGFETRGRFGTLSGDSNEYELSQTGGSSWGTGSFFAGAEYFHRDVLFALDRSYSRNSDQRPNGGANYSPLTGSPGNVLCTAFDGSCNFFDPAFAVPKGQDGTALSVAQLLPVGPAPEFAGAEFGNGNAGIPLVAEEKKASAFVSLAQDLGSRAKASLGLRFNHRPIAYDSPQQGGLLQVPSSNPYYLDVFGNGEPLYVYKGFGPDISLRTQGDNYSYNGTGGLTVLLGGDWSARASVSYAKQVLKFRTQYFDSDLLGQALGNPSFLGTPTYDPTMSGYYNPFSDTQSSTNLAVLRAATRDLSEHSVWWTSDATAQLEGRLFNLGAGPVRAAFGVNWREEAGKYYGDLPFSDPFSAGNLKELVRAAFAELNVPVLDSRLGVGNAGDLRFSLAGRYEEYVGYRSTFNPKLGLNWRPAQWVGLRAMWGTSFRAPSPADRDSTYFNRGIVEIQDITDPKSPTGTARALLLFGGADPSLHEERAASWSAGVDIQPVALPRTKISGTYYRTRYKDRIGRGGVPGQEFEILNQEAAWQGIIIRDPSPALVTELCGRTSSPTPGCEVSQPNVVVDFSTRNLALQTIAGIDFQVSHSLDTSEGLFDAALNINRTLKNETALSLASPRVSILDTPGAPLSWHGRFDLTWSYRLIQASASLNYQPRYTDPYAGISDKEVRPISSWTTVDVTFGARSTSGWLSGTSLLLTVANLLNRDPPYVDAPLGYDTNSANPYGRAASVQVTRSW